MTNDKQPIYILSDNVQRTLGKDAQRNNIMAARMVADTVKTTLGPKGMDKMLVNAIGDIIITNDGVTILEEMEIEHPAAKMMVEVAKTQEEAVGDGTTTAVVLAGKLLENAEKLLDQRIHPTVITKGYRMAAEKAHEILEKISIKLDVNNKALLKQIAITAMTGKGAETAKDKLSEVIVNAVGTVAETIDYKIKVDQSNIKLEKKKGMGIENTELIRGIVLDKEIVSTDMPSSIKNAKIALIDAALELKSPETDTKIEISTPEQLQAFIDNEERFLKAMVEKLKKSGASVILCQKGIDDVAQYYLSQANIMAVRRITKSDIEKLAKATGGKIVSNLNELSEKELGFAGLVEEIKEGDNSLLYIRECKNPKAVTILIRGGTEHVIDEIERAIKDAIGDLAASLEEGKIVAGGGACEIELAKQLRAFSNTISGREKLAVEEFALALESIPIILAENSGLDPIDILTELKAKHNADPNAGIDVYNGKIENMARLGVIEPLKIKTQAIKSATEVATMILRIDDIIAASTKGGSPGMPPNVQMPEGY